MNRDGILFYLEPVSPFSEALKAGVTIRYLFNSLTITGHSRNISWPDIDPAWVLGLKCKIADGWVGARSG
jgi:hypothetical protein